MFTQSFETRFSDTDALGHINNAMLPIWFEGARDPIFKMFMPELDLSNWRLILAKMDVTFHAQMFYGKSIEIRTYIGRIGHSSFDVYQELWQRDMKKASGTAVMVHFHNEHKKSESIPADILEQLKLHLYEPEKS
jgi:acyl-CoA thioester hydrolase